MAEGFEVDIDRIDRLADDTRTLMDQVRAAEASARNPIDPLSFGAIGTLWSEGLSWWTEDAANFARSAADCGDRVADELNNMAETYRNTDDAGRQALNDVLARLDDGPQFKDGKQEA